MSVSFKVVLASIFPDVYQYDDEYDELFANTKLNVLNYPYPIRKLFYDYYDVNMDKNKMVTTQDINDYMNNDKELLYVKNPTVTAVWYNKELSKIEYIKYNHFIEQDYKYINSKQNVRNHMTLKHIIYYEQFNNYNINYYIQNNIFPLCEKYDKTVLSRVIDYDCVIKYYNNINRYNLDISVIIKRFLTDEDKLMEFINLLTCDSLRLEYYQTYIKDNNDKYIQYTFNKWKNSIDNDKFVNYDKDIYPLLLKYYNSHLNNIYDDVINGNYNDVYGFVKYGLNIKDDDKNNLYNNWFNIAFIFIYFMKVYDLLYTDEKTFDLYLNCCNSKKYTNEKLKFQTSIINKFDNEYVIDKIYYQLDNLNEPFYNLKAFPFIINKYDIFKFVDNMEEYIVYVEDHKQQIENYPRVVFMFLIHLMMLYEYQNKVNSNNEQSNKIKNNINKDYIKQYIYNYKSLIDYYSHKFNNEHSLAYYWVNYIHEEPFYEIYSSPQVDNIAKLWKSLFSTQPPKEMTDIKYYNYMMKNNGTKRPQNITAFYSYFSNTNENKFIFINNDNILEHEAKLRYIIPIDYQQVKTFLTEELETNDICLFTKLSDKDWQKIAGGNDRIDCVVFSDWADIFRHRTTPTKLIKYFKESIELKFDITLKDENNNE